MPGEVSRWLASGPVQRQYNRELAAIDAQGAAAEARVENIGRVTRLAMFEALTIHTLKKQAEAMAPDGAELYTMIAVAGTIEMAQVINTLGRRGRI
jgi:hypothetical protein